MSFTFNWPRFSDQFHYDAIQMLNTALNKGNKPPIIADKIEVVELEMGTQPPELEIRDIGDLTVDQFRGIFRMTYAGDAHLVLKTKVQANPLNHKQPDIHLMGGSSGMLAAKHPLVVPMLLRLSHFRLSSYVVLVISKQKGITLVFKTDPLQNVDINSTFDSITVIQNFIQREIEGQLRQMFREDLPSIIHRLSQQWVKAKVEAPYLSKRPPPPTQRHSFDSVSTSEIPTHQPLASDVGLHPSLHRKTSLNSLGSRKPRSGISVTSTGRIPNAKLPPPPQTPTEVSSSSHPDLENFDPTYGLRPEGLPTKSVFKGFSNLFQPNKGLADLTEEAESSDFGEYDEDEGGSFDFVDWEETAPAISPPSSEYNDRERERENSTEYETIPAVGGGTITRPRIYHSQSVIQPHASAVPLSKSLLSLPSRSYSQASIIRSGLATPSFFAGQPTSATSSYFPEYQYPAGPSRISTSVMSASGVSARTPRTALYMSSSFTGRPPTPDSLESQPSRSSSGPTRTLSTDPTDHASYDSPSHTSSPSAAAANSAIYIQRRHERRLSVTSTTSTANHTELRSTSPSNHLLHLQDYSGDSSGHPKIILRPSLNNNSIHQLSTLSHSYHTLSPYTRDLSHFTVRSVPPRSLSAGASGLGLAGLGMAAVGGERPPVRAKRKRTYRLGQKKPAALPADTTQLPSAYQREVPLHPSSPTPPSEFDVSDMDRYFPSAHGEFQDATVRSSHRTSRPSLRPHLSGSAAPSMTSHRSRREI